MSARSELEQALIDRQTANDANFFTIINQIRVLMGLPEMDGAPAPTVPDLPVITSVTGVVPGQLDAPDVVTINGTGTNGATVNIYDNGALLGTTSVSSGVWAYTTPTLTSDQHKITATQTIDGQESLPCEI